MGRTRKSVLDLRIKFLIETFYYSYEAIQLMLDIKSFDKYYLNFSFGSLMTRDLNRRLNA